MYLWPLSHRQHKTTLYHHRYNAVVVWTTVDLLQLSVELFPDMKVVVLRRRFEFLNLFEIKKILKLSGGYIYI